MIEYNDNLESFAALSDKERAEVLAVSALMAAAQIKDADKRLELITATLDYFRSEMAFELLVITLDFTLRCHPRTIAQRVARAVNASESSRAEMGERFKNLAHELLQPEKEP